MRLTLLLGLINARATARQLANLLPDLPHQSHQEQRRSGRETLGSHWLAQASLPYHNACSKRNSFLRELWWTVSLKQTSILSISNLPYCFLISVLAIFIASTVAIVL